MVVSVVGSIGWAFGVWEISRVLGRMGVASLLPHFWHNQSRGGVTTNPETDLWLDQPIQPPVPGTKLLVKPEGGDPDPHASQESPPCSCFAGPAFSGEL